MVCWDTNVGGGIINSFAKGNVNGSSSNGVGGLLGRQSGAVGDITNSFAMGNVNGRDRCRWFGGIPI